VTGVQTCALPIFEEVARETLAAALEEEAASRKRVEQNAIAVAERVGRELVQLAFGNAMSRPQAAIGEAGHAVESARAFGEEPFAPQSDAIRADGAAPASQTGEFPDADRRVPMPAARTAPAALLPWLAALTLAVLYLLVRGFL